jgi:hypothetical protein
MTRNLKALLLALTAVLALGAFAAASASAKYDSEIEKTLLHGTNTGEHTFTTSVGNVVCNNATFKGSQTGTLVNTPEKAYTAKTIKVLPSYNNCKAFGFNAEVKMNGCEYEFLEPTSLKASTKILCPTGKQIEIVAFGFCTMTVGAQSPGGTVSYTNEGAGSGRFTKTTSAVTGIVYGGNCGSGNNGTYSGVTDVRGYSKEPFEPANQVGIWVTS